MKTILITGATDGIGKMAAEKLAAYGNTVLVHGRNPAKVEKVASDIADETSADVYSYIADLSDLMETKALGDQVRAEHEKIDVLINNAGVLTVDESAEQRNDKLDLRFVVNTLAPAVLTQRLIGNIAPSGRIVNVASAAQAPVIAEVMTGKETGLGDMAIYAQSKLALIIWGEALAAQHPDGPLVVSVNPGSYLASKMVTEGLGMRGNDLSIGANILCEAALSDTFGQTSGLYYDNDERRFASPHIAATDPEHVALVLGLIEAHMI